jgi:methyl-accepting chemotaxis protein
MGIRFRNTLLLVGVSWISHRKTLGRAIMPKTSNHIRLSKIFACSVAVAVAATAMECLFDALDGATGSGFSMVVRGVELLACTFGVFFLFLVALGKWHQRLAPIRERTASEPVDADHHEIPARVAEVRRLLGSVPQLTELLRSQLDETNRINGESALSVLEQISNVRGEASNLLSSLADAKAEATAMREHANASISSSRRRLSEMEDDNILRERAIREGNAAIERTIALMGTLAPLTNAIGTFSKQTRLIAFNAAIRATNDGSIGRGFVAVAEEMRKLAVQIESTSNQVDDVMGRISETVKGKLVGMASMDLIETERDRMRTLTGSMTRMSADFDAAVSGVDRLATHLHGAVETILAATVKAQELSWKQDVSHREIEHVREGLALCGDRLGNAAKPLSIGTGRIDDLLGTLEG